MKTFNEYLTEKVLGYTSLYHSTPLQKGTNILKDGFLKFQELQKTEYDLLHKANFDPSPYRSFISMARSNNNHFIKSLIEDFSQPIITFSFEKEIIASKYKVVPVDYFYTGHRKKRGISEQEDRILSKEYTDKLDLNSTCNGCFIFLRQDHHGFDDEYPHQVNFREDPFMIHAENYEFPIYGFNVEQENDFLNLNIQKATPLLNVYK